MRARHPTVAGFVVPFLVGAPAAASEPVTTTPTSAVNPAAPNRPPAAAAPDALSTPPPKGKRGSRLERLGIAGGLLVGQTYTYSVGAATAAILVCKADEASSACLLPSKQAAWYDLYIPLAGPFVALRHEPVRSNWRYFLPFGALGLGQVVGASLAATYLLWPEQTGGGEARLAPWFSPFSAGLSATGTF